MSKFKLGDEVTKKTKGGWARNNGNGIVHNYGPQFGEIVHVKAYHPLNDDFFQVQEYQALNEINEVDHYHDDDFEKVISTPMLYKEIERKTQEA
jgi:hypothetical protein